MSLDPRKAIPVPAGYYRSVLQRLGDTPERCAALLKGTDIDAAKLQQDDTVTLYASLRIVENLCREFGEDWPLQVLGTWKSAMQGSLEVAARSAATVGDSLEIVARFAHVRAPHLALASIKEQTRRGIVLAPGVAMSEAAWRSRVMTAMMSIGAILEEILQGDAQGVSFEFSWPTPAYAERLRSVLPGAVQFSSRANAIIVPSALCARPSPFADRVLLARSIGDLELAAMNVAGVDTLPLRLEQLLYSRKERLSVDQAARMLGMSRRTLARRLAEHGVSFRSTQERVRRQRADELLASRKLSRAQLATALGYSEPTSMSRARRRWAKPGD
jgi:AraC-like DNA-binding protein